MLRRSAVLAFAVVPGLLAFSQAARAQGDAPAAPAASSAAPPAAVAPAPAPAPAPAKPTLIPPEVDEKQLKAPESTPTATATVGATPKASSGEIVSDDWWTHTRPLVEIHGFFRTRGEVFHNFSLGRNDAAVDAQATGLFPRPLDDSWTDTKGTTHFTGGCGPTPSNPTDNPTTTNCENKTNASANLRFRIDPEIHISDNLRIISQIDFLDNLVLGSTPEGYVNEPGAPGQYNNPGRIGYVPLRAFSTTQVPPTSGINSYQNSIAVKRVWAEYATPIGQLRFGRMPSHWGLGILVNSGDKIDSDYQTTADRILFVTGSRALDVYVAGAWDFPNSGRTSQTVFDQQGQPYNLSQLENTNQWVLTAFRRVRPEILKQKLARGEVVVNGGTYVVYRQQLLANENSAPAGSSSNASSSLGTSADAYQRGLTRLGAKAWIPDFWLQVLTKNLRWETEAVYIYGSIENPVLVSNGTYANYNYKIRQFGIATELEYRALNDDLKLRFYSGFASGDQGVDSISPGQGLQPRLAGDNTISTFRFNPDYRIDLILFRNILTRVQGVYYFKPGVEYDFTKSLDGEKFGGRAEIIYSRASVPVQAPGNKADLGIELDLSLYYQSKDGTLNNDPSKIGGFYGMLQYGVLFPLGGLDYPEGMPNPGNDVSS
ncbi:MAG: TIGR04551 family protein, partial [Polyangiales bacterium]